MGFGQTVILAAFAGLTIYLGLPVGRLRNISSKTQALLTAGAGGVILFLIFDVLQQAVEPVSSDLEAVTRGGGPPATFALDALVLGGSIALGLLSVTWVTTRLRSRSTGLVLPRQLALGTAIGLGLHNFSEGLAIGQSAATGATSLALILVIGFALHNATEGFGIAAPLASGDLPSWRFLGAMGVIGGGPTFLGGIVGYSFVAPLLSIAFLGLAAGALIFVFNEMMAVSRRMSVPMVATSALLIGLLAGFGTDFILTAAGV
ncbi:MAG TPA: zinc permease [Verrucomicrobiae bacterium]|jgi:ZIP family zinc transporter|nr:zinc permease [Verrucomicrobiae bacterium]